MSDNNVVLEITVREYKRLRALNERLTEMLEKLEVTGYQSSGHCPVCEAWQPQSLGHAPDCEYAALLKEAK